MFGAVIDIGRVGQVPPVLAQEGGAPALLLLAFVDKEKGGVPCSGRGEINVAKDADEDTDGGGEVHRVGGARGSQLPHTFCGFLSLVKPNPRMLDRATYILQGRSLQLKGMTGHQ